MSSGGKRADDIRLYRQSIEPARQTGDGALGAPRPMEGVMDHPLPAEQAHNVRPYGDLRNTYLSANAAAFAVLCQGSDQQTSWASCGEERQRGSGYLSKN